MIEEIVRPDTLGALLVSLMIAAVSTVIIWFLAFNFATIKLLLLFIPCIIMIGVIMNDTGNTHYDWRESVNAQIESLGCEDLQEAYDLYGFESAKERFLFECVETRDGWWK